MIDSRTVIVQYMVTMLTVAFTEVRYIVARQTAQEFSNPSVTVFWFAAVGRRLPNSVIPSHGEPSLRALAYPLN